MSERTKNFALFLGVLVVLDLAAAQVYDRLARALEPPGPEGPYRIPFPPYHHDLVRNADIHARWGPRSYPLRTNSLGFRDERVWSVPLRSDATRLLVLGDSFAEAVGVPFTESFPGILAQRLRPQGVEVLNAGVASYSPALYFRKARFWIEQIGLDVDAFVVLIDVSDVLDEARLDETGRVRVPIEDPDTPAGRLLLEQVNHVLKEYSLIMKAAAQMRILARRGLGERGHRARLALDAEEAAWDYDPEAYREWGERGLRAGAENMDRLLALSHRREIPMAVVVYPWPDQVYRRQLDSRQVTFWRAWTEGRGVPFIDLFPRFITERDPEAAIREYYIPYDFHWSQAGHRLVAEALLESGLPELIAAARALESNPARSSETSQ